MPKRASATASDQRSAAQYGHHSAPTYRTRGTPFAVSAAPDSFLSDEVGSELPVPTLVRTEAGTCVTSLKIAAEATPPAFPDFGLLSWASLTATRVMTIAAMTAMGTTVHQTRELPPPPVRARATALDAAWRRAALLWAGRAVLLAALAAGLGAGFAVDLGVDVLAVLADGSVLGRAVGPDLAADFADALAPP